MGGAGAVWNVAAVYPLWATMAVGAGVFVGRVVQWVGYDQDIQVYHAHRKADPADSDFLDQHGPAYFNHPLRKWLHARPSPLIFPEPAAIDPVDEE